jgi:hypothetical protein
MIKETFWEIAAATIEDLAIGVRSSREPDEVGKRSGWVIEKTV